VTFILIIIKNSVSASQKTHCISITENHQLGLFRELIDRNLLIWRCETDKYTARGQYLGITWPLLGFEVMHFFPHQINGQRWWRSR
jgi:hypothetical protein